MKRILGVIFIVAIIGVAPASAQGRFGVKGGVNISKVHFNKSIVNSDNFTGFNIGPMVEFTVPLLGVGMDAAILYSRKGVDFKSEGNIGSKSYKADYLDIPLNLKWKFGLPILKAYLTAGPYASFRVGGDKIWNVVHDQVKAKSFGAGLNFGAGVEVIRHLQVGFNYELGLSNAFEGQEGVIDGKNRGWSITAAVLF